jgi:threonine dehydrogenase-like Zn-dependent dehydrogenase
VPSPTTIRRLAYHGAGRLTLDEAPCPVPGPGELRVDVHAVGLCRSDVYGVTGVNARRDEVLRGDGDVLVMGHEAVGRVGALGPGVDGPPLGTLVAVDPMAGCGRCSRCRAGDDHLCGQRRVHGCAPDAPGAYADALVVPAGCAHPFSERVPAEWGALVEPLAVGFHGVRIGAGPGADDVAAGGRLLVVGGGIIGLGAALAGRRRGRETILVEPQAERRALAAALGLDAVTPDDAPTSADLVVDCVGRPETIARAVATVPPGGTVVLVGIWEDVVRVPIGAVVGREARLLGSYGYSRADFAAVTAWVGSGRLDLAPLIEERVGFDGVIGAFERYADGSLNAVRTLFLPGGES